MYKIIDEVNLSNTVKGFTCPYCGNKIENFRQGYLCQSCGAEFKWTGKVAGEFWIESTPHLLWDKLVLEQREHSQCKDKISRRNMQIKELKKHYIGHLSMKELEENSLRVFGIGKCKKCHKPVKQILCADCAKEYAETKQDY